MTFANDNELPVSAALKVVVVRQFSPCGPCLTLGKLVRSTERFRVFTEWQGRADFTGRERRIACESVHLAPCPSCTDHPGTQYPNGYID